jgi:predicted Fe-Mo cluster-binding NifX family protein
MRIAVASKSGTEVDQHFGHAERFLIYDCACGKPTPLGEVQVEKYCSFDQDHPFRHRQFNAIVDALQGCRAVVTAMIGDLPRQELKNVGIESITTGGPIDQAILKAHHLICGCGFKGTKSC